MSKAFGTNGVVSLVFLAFGMVAGAQSATAQVDICALMDGRRGSDGCCYLPDGRADCGDSRQDGGTVPPDRSTLPPPAIQTNTALRNPCPSEWLGDGDCDEPEGLNLCAEGTDVQDCSNPFSNYGTGPGWSGGATLGPNTTALHNPCPWTKDGDCDEPEGLNLCAEGTDIADCSNPNSNYGGGSGYQSGRAGHLIATPGTPPPMGLPTSIRIQFATYGGNCGADHGNVTSFIVAECQGRMDCRYVIDYRVIGDPAVGCPKDYVVQYTCGNSQPRIARAEPEAGFRSLVSLMCSP